MSAKVEQGFLEFWVDNEFAPYIYGQLEAAFHAGAEWERSQQSEPAGLQMLGKRLAELLDEDQFAECEALLLAAAPKPPVQEPVATVIQRAPYEDGTINPCKSLQWSGNNAEDDLAVGTKLYAAPQPSDDVAKTALVVAASAALLEIECLMKEAYNSATPVCCQRAGQECCGDSLPEWSEYDQRTMDRFAPHQRALNEALRAIDAAMAGGGE